VRNVLNIKKLILFYNTIVTFTAIFCNNYNYNRAVILDNFNRIAMNYSSRLTRPWGRMQWERAFCPLLALSLETIAVAKSLFDVSRHFSPRARDPVLFIIPRNATESLDVTKPMYIHRKSGQLHTC